MLGNSKDAIVGRIICHTRHLSNQRDYDNPTSPRGVGQIIKNVHSDPTQSHFIPANITFRSPRNSISRTSRRRWLFNLLACGKKGGGEGGGRNAWKEGSVLLPRRRGKKGEAHTRSGFFSPHPPREIIDSQRGNDVVNTTSVAHPLEPAPFFSPTLPTPPQPPPFCYQAPPSCAASSSRNPPLFPPSRLLFSALPACTIHVLQLISTRSFSFFARIVFFSLFRLSFEMICFGCESGA